jgi:hypothetical protein
MRQPAGLISVLLNRNASVEERDDAAMDLAAYSDPDVEAALLCAARDPSTPAIVIDSCADSLAEMWIRRGGVPSLGLASLPPRARAEAVAMILACAPSLVPPQ